MYLEGISPLYAARCLTCNGCGLGNGLITQRIDGTLHIPLCLDCLGNGWQDQREWITTKRWFINRRMGFSPKQIVHLTTIPEVYL